jgi:threonine dehydratase
MIAPVSSYNAPFTLADVQAAAERIQGAVVRTPTLHSKTLSAITGANVWLKFENLQFTAAYKERGALNTLAQLSAEERARGVIAASAGNHAQGLAYHCKGLSVPVTIVMPKQTPIVKVQQTLGHGAYVVLEGDTFDAAYAHACTLRDAQGLSFVHPFDNPKIMAGQGTVALEMLQDVPELDMLIIPVGGGGLISGCAVAAKGMKPHVQVIGVQSNRYPSMYSFKTGKHMPCGGDTLAEGIAVKEPGLITRQVVAEYVDEMRIVSESIIEEAISLLLDVEKTVVEGAGAAGLAALLPVKSGAFRPEFAGRNVGVILTGGNIDTRFLANVILRNLARTGKMGRIAVLLNDRSGALHELSGIFTRHGANITDVSHQRIFGVLSAKSTRIELEYEIRDTGALKGLLHELETADYTYEVMSIAGSKGGKALRKA